MSARAVVATAAKLYLLPVTTRVPLKFGPEVTTQVTCARACVTVRGADGATASGWGETPLSVQWVWPNDLPYAKRHAALIDLSTRIAATWAASGRAGHPLQLGVGFLDHQLPALLEECNRERPAGTEIPWLAALVCASAFDIATHDAYGNLHALPIYDCYGPEHLDHDLSTYFDDPSFRGRYPADYLSQAPPRQLVAWHLVGGLDPLDSADLRGDEPDDGYPVLLEDWLERDGLTALKVKLRGTDPEWDYARLTAVGEIGARRGVRWLSADFNCTVTDPAYVTDILDRLLSEQPAVYASILYVEQPFPYELEQHRIDVRPVVARKPLFMDESAHDWKLVQLGRALGWSGVALKTCKTQSGALLSLCWARHHGMTLMVQDLTNPMLAQIPHVQLAAHAGTIMGVETNAMQFYPEASAAEAVVHPGVYRRRAGQVDWGTVRGPGFGYRLDEIDRPLPAPVA